MLNKKLPSVNVKQVKESLLGQWAEARLNAREIIKDDRFHNPQGLYYLEHRERVLKQVGLLAQTGVTVKAFPKEFVGAGGDDFGGHVAGFAELFLADPSLQIKSGVQFGLFAAAIQHLGTRKHHELYLKDALDAKMLGCFGMTESGHGSDVFNIQTTATYDPAADEFVINTPSRDAWKDYLGNAATHGRWAVVFAQLYTPDGVKHGVHAFLVRIRTDRGRFVKGVSGEDDGVKGGLNGIDNGRLAFDNVRVPRDNLLDKFGSVTRDGVYVSPIENERRRFFIMLSTLVQGRVSLDGAAVVAAKAALQIAVSYSNRRRQFTSLEKHGEEVLLMDYHEHQRRLIPLVAKTYAAAYAHEDLLDEFVQVFSRMVSSETVGEVPGMQDLENNAAAYKALSTWHALNTLQQTREACGGNGFLASNRLTGWKSDFDVYVTFEGDNTVLLQLVGKRLLSDYSDRFKSMPPWKAVQTIAAENVSRLVKYKFADLSSGKVIASLLEDRWQVLVSEIAHDLLVAQKTHASMEETFNMDQSKLVEAAKAYGEWKRFKAFYNHVRNINDADTRETLLALQTLYGLTVINENNGWFIRKGLLTISQGSKVEELFHKLLPLLRPHVQDLVDSFGYEKEHLRAAVLD